MTFYEFINYGKDKVCKFKLLNNLREMAPGEKFCPGVTFHNGETFDAILDAIDAEHLGAALKPVLGKDTLLCTDGSKAFKAMAKDAGILHQAMNIKAGIRVKGQIFHIQNVNAYNSRLKGWMQRFKGVATRYLDSYLG